MVEVVVGECVEQLLRCAAVQARAGRRVRLVPTRANSQPAFRCYLADPTAPTAHRTGLLVLTLSNHRISAITRFLDDNLTRHFELVDTHRH